MDIPISFHPYSKTECFICIEDYEKYELIGKVLTSLGGFELPRKGGWIFLYNNIPKLKKELKLPTGFIKDSISQIQSMYYNESQNMSKCDSQNMSKYDSQNMSKCESQNMSKCDDDRRNIQERSNKPSTLTNHIRSQIKRSNNDNKSPMSDNDSNSKYNDDRHRVNSDNCLSKSELSDDNYDDISEEELIQNVLAKKLLSESAQKIIDSETIADSDDEDIITLSRRLRHIYSLLNKACNH